MKIVKVLLLLLTLISFSLHAQQLEWARNFENDAQIFISSVIADDQGNSYGIGYASSPTFDLDPSNNVFEINYAPADFVSVYTFLVKLNSQGNFLWGEKLGVFNSHDTSEIKIGPDGYIYSLQSVRDDIDDNTSTLIINKIDNNGNIQFTKVITDEGNNNASFINSNSIDIDSSSNIYIAGRFANTVTIDPANPQFNLSYLGLGAFVLKINSTGDIVWRKAFNDSQNEQSIIKLAVRQDGNINLLLGIYVTDDNNNHAYHQKLYKIDGNNNNILWEKTFEDQTPNAFVTAPNGDIAITSSFRQGTIDVDPSTSNQHLITSNSPDNSYILWLTPEGEFSNIQVNYNQISFIKNITVDNNYNYYLVGWLVDGVNPNLDLDPGTEELIISLDGQVTVSYITKYDSTHNFSTGFKLGSVSFTVYDISAIDDNNIYLVGNFSGNNDFDPGANEYWIDSTVLFNAFTMKLGSCNLMAPQGNTNQYYCLDQSPTVSHLTPNASNIEWFGSSTSTTPLESTTPLVDGQIYYAARISNCGIPERLAVTVHINPSPLAPTALNQQFCKSVNPTIANLTAIGTDIKWYSDNTSTTPLSITTTLGNGQYYASQTVNSCESPRIVITVTLITTPSAIATTSQSFCADINPTIADLEITGTDIKVYNAELGGNLLEVSTLLVDGHIYYASQILNGCESEQRTAITVTINNTPPPTANTTQVFCAGDLPTLSTVNISGTAIKWYDAASGGNLLSENSLLTTTTYYASQTLNGCESTIRATINITVDSANINATDYEIYYCDESNDGKEVVDITKLTHNFVTSPSNYSFSYYLSAIAAEDKITDQLVSNPETLLISTGITFVFIRIESPGGCFKVVVLKMQLAPITPKILSSSDYYICKDNNTVIKPNSGFSDFKWSTGATTSILSVNKPGNYSVTATYNHAEISCITSFNFTVHELPSTQITKVLTTDWTNNQNTITVLTTPGNDNEYSIDGSNYQPENYFSHLQPGIYKVHARDINGCGYDSDEVILLNYPKYFTPNSDGKNDYWKINFSFFEDDLEVAIYDRYGKLIKALKNDDIGWDGTLNQKPMPATDYWFIVKRANGKEYKGHFALIR